MGLIYQPSSDGTQRNIPSKAKIFSVRSFPWTCPRIELDRKSGHPLQTPRGTTDIKMLVDQVNQKHKAKVGNIFRAFFKKEEYYDRKVQVSSFKVGEYVILLNPEEDTQFDKTQFKSFH